jgi:hypothetical protein
MYQNNPNLEGIMMHLNALSNPENIAGMARHGICPAPPLRLIWHLNGRSVWKNLSAGLDLL